MTERIFTEEDYRKAVLRFLEICDSEPNTPDFEEAIQLTRFMEEYEKFSCYERRQLN